jgi:hypothetical protein
MMAWKRETVGSCSSDTALVEAWWEDMTSYLGNSHPDRRSSVLNRGVTTYGSPTRHVCWSLPGCRVTTLKSPASVASRNWPLLTC